MKNIRKYLWIAGVLVVFTVAVIYPQYVLDAAKAIILIIGEDQCGCE